MPCIRLAVAPTTRLSVARIRTPVFAIEGSLESTRWDLQNDIKHLLSQIIDKLEIVFLVSLQ